ncbi:MAG: hypothetical protein MJ175_05460 [Clostridia bacterium]|nr:hypothetical protein [Clostridia bacterium]
MKNILYFVINAALLIVFWAWLSYFDLLAPQFQMRPAAEKAIKWNSEEHLIRLFDNPNHQSILDLYGIEGWIGQGSDFQFWDKYFGNLFDSSAETGTTEDDQEEENRQ